MSLEIKAEHDINIKPEPSDHVGSPMLAEDDVYEDTGELNFPKDPPDIWLTRLPKWLWKVLSETGNDDEEIEIGKIKVFDSADPSDPTKMKMRLELHKDWKKASEIPKKYDMSITNMNPTNTYVFSEKDLPGYKGGGFGRTRNEGLSANYDANRSGSYRVQKYRHRIRRAIPKQTGLVSKSLHELSCQPVVNAEFREFQGLRNKQVLQGKNARTVTEDNIQALNANVNVDHFAGWIQTGENRNRHNATNKAARIPEKELLQLLFSCFQEYKFWHMRTLRHRTKQPEMYLRQVLSQIAVLSKSGHSSGTWRLKEENQLDKYNVKEEVAPEEVGSDMEEVEGGGDEGEGDDDENAEMVDVL